MRTLLLLLLVGSDRLVDVLEDGIQTLVLYCLDHVLQKKKMKSFADFSSDSNYISNYSQLSDSDHLP